MNFRRLIRRAGVGVVLVFAGALIPIHIGTGELVAPTRRPLQDYHTEWMTNQGVHGISVHAFGCLAGRVPCLIVTPEVGNGCSQRGAAIRAQLSSDGMELAPWGTVCANLVLLHGRHGRKEDMLPIAERFCAAGFRCLLPDLPAHGESPIPSVDFGSTAFDSDLASTVLHECAEKFAFDSSPAALWGMSMGGAFAASSACSHPSDWYCLVIVSSFDTLDGVIEEQCRQRAGGFGPVLASAIRQNSLRRTGLDTATVRPFEWAHQVQLPVFVAHGTNDPVIQMHRGRALFESFAAIEKKWVAVNGADHNNVLITPMPLYAAMAGWLLQHLPARKSGSA